MAFKIPKEITPQQVAEQLKQGRELILLDVRESEEWAEGHVKGAKHIPLSQIVERFHELNPTKETIIMCRSGSRSGLRAYLYIEKERFGDRLEVEWNLPDHLDAKLPPLTIQPIVENAIRHGILSRTSGGKLSISASKEEDYIKFVIHDDGVGMDETKLSSLLDGKKKAGTSGVGLTNTDRRVKKIYGQGLLIESIPGEGTTVSFIVPKKGKHLA